MSLFVELTMPMTLAAMALSLLVGCSLLSAAGPQVKTALSVRKIACAGIGLLKQNNMQDERCNRHNIKTREMGAIRTSSWIRNWV